MAKITLTNMKGFILNKKSIEDSNVQQPLFLSEDDYLSKLERSIESSDIAYAPRYCLNLARSLVMRGYDLLVGISDPAYIDLFVRMAKQTKSEIEVIWD